MKIKTRKLLVLVAGIGFFLAPALALPQTTGKTAAPEPTRSPANAPATATPQVDEDYYLKLLRDELRREEEMTKPGEKPKNTDPDPRSWRRGFEEGLPGGKKPSKQQKNYEEFRGFRFLPDGEEGASPDQVQPEKDPAGPPAKGKPPLRRVPQAENKESKSGGDQGGKSKPPAADK